MPVVYNLLPDFAARSDLSPTAKLLFADVVSWHRTTERSYRFGCIVASRRLHCSERSARRAKAELVEKGYVVASKEFGGWLPANPNRRRKRLLDSTNTGPCIRIFTATLRGDNPQDLVVRLREASNRKTFASDIINYGWIYTLSLGGENPVWNADRYVSERSAPPEWLEETPHRVTERARSIRASLRRLEAAGIIRIGPGWEAELIVVPAARPPVALLPGAGGNSGIARPTEPTLYERIEQFKRQQRQQSQSG